MAINSDQDIVLARQKGRAMAAELGFLSGDATLIATAISELARNIVTYAGKGHITLKGIQNSSHVGILVVASEQTFDKLCETASPLREVSGSGCPECGDSWTNLKLPPSLAGGQQWR